MAREPLIDRLEREALEREALRTPHPAETAEMLDRESRDRAGMAPVPGRAKVIEAGVNAASLEAKLNALTAEDWFPAFSVGKLIVLLRDIEINEEPG